MASQRRLATLSSATIGNLSRRILYRAYSINSHAAASLYSTPCRITFLLDTLASVLVSMTCCLVGLHFLSSTPLKVVALAMMRGKTIFICAGGERLRAKAMSGRALRLNVVPLGSSEEGRILNYKFCQQSLSFARIIRARTNILQTFRHELDYVLKISIIGHFPTLACHGVDILNERLFAVFAQVLLNPITGIIGGADWRLRLGVLVVPDVGAYLIVASLL